MATLDEASHCPKCGEPGAVKPGYETIREGRHRGAKVYIYMCTNERCVWLNTGWTVQVNPDGTIPERVKGPKEHPQLDSFAEAAARRQLEDLAFHDPQVKEALDLDLDK
jgi:hypothetical protein